MMSLSGLGMVLIAVAGGLRARRLKRVVPYIGVILLSYKMLGMDSAVYVGFFLGCYQLSYGVIRAIRISRKQKRMAKTRQAYQNNHVIKQAEKLYD